MKFFCSNCLKGGGEKVGTFPGERVHIPPNGTFGKWTSTQKLAVPGRGYVIVPRRVFFQPLVDVFSSCFLPMEMDWLCKT